MILSIKMRLSLMSLAVNALVLGILAIVAVNWYKAEQFRNIDTFLQTETQGVVVALGTYFVGSNRGVGQYGAVSLDELDGRLQSYEFIALLNRLIDARVNQPRAYKTTFGVFNRTGALLMVSNTALPMDILRPGTSITSNNGPWEVESVHVGIDSTDLNYRIMTLPLEVGGVRLAYVRMACLLDPVVENIHQFQTFVLLVLPILLLLNALASVFLLDRAFRPVTRIIEAIHRITERNLTVRVPITGGSDEIHRLATTFNDMLDRVDRAFMFHIRLVEDMSHQLRTPLAVMHGLLETSLRHDRSIAEYREVINSSLEEVEYIGALVDGMLLLAQLDSHVMQLQPLNIASFLQDLSEELEPLRDEKSIKMELGPVEPTSDHPILVAADVLRLRQLFINLMDNACKYSPEHGVVEVCWQTEDVDDIAMVRVVILNHGPAIPSDLLERIFDRFYRIEYEVPHYGQGVHRFGRPSGFGLGLSICRSIAEHHNGSIRAFNPPGGGAAFEVMLRAVMPQ